jgi:glutaredoxin
MKFCISLLASLVLITSGIAQQKDIEVFEKKDGIKNIVYARNTGKVSYLVTINITSQGMDVTPSSKAEAVVPAGFMKEMATIVPRPGEGWSYGYEVSFTEYAGELPKTTTPSKTDAPLTSTPTPAKTPAPAPELSSAPIIVYTQAGCGRCSTVKKEMNAKGISFLEVDVNSSSPEVADMWKKLRDGGFTGTSVTMPVVKVDGKLHYNIKDLMGFVAGLK